MADMISMQEENKLQGLLKQIKLWHVAALMVAGLIAFGIGIGRFEAKGVAQERHVEAIESDSKERIEKLEKDTNRKVKAIESEVIRHLDQLSAEAHETSRRIDDTHAILRDLASDVAVLCSKSKGGGCSHR